MSTENNKPEDFSEKDTIRSVKIDEKQNFTIVEKGNKQEIRKEISSHYSEGLDEDSLKGLCEDTKLLKKNSKRSDEIRQEGNHLYKKNYNKQDTNAKILFLYTKSAAFAENNSEELAFAYGNRSGLLMNFCKYKESLVDIERALKITKSDKLIEKLLTRKLKCLSLKDKNVNQKVDLVSSYEVPIPTMKPSKTIPCASELVSLKFDEKYGRHVVANQDIEPGTIVAMEKGVLFPELNKLYLYCSHCLNLAYNGIPCDSCAIVIYCSEECKKEAWNCYHDVECSILPYLILLKNVEIWKIKPAIVILRIFIESVKKEGIDSIIQQARDIDDNAAKDGNLENFFYSGLFQSMRFKSIYCLSEQTLKLDIKNLITKAVNLLCIKTQFFKKFSEDVEIKRSMNKIFSKLFYILANNGFKYQHINNNYDYPSDAIEAENSKHKMGSIFVTFCSLFNHSCKQNISRTFFNGQVILFSVNHIEKGQQLFLTYGPTIYDPMIKRKMKLSAFDFICDCKFCKGNFWIDKMDQELYDKQVYVQQHILLPQFIEVGALKTFNTMVNRSRIYPITKKILKDVKKMMRIVNKYCTNNLSMIEHLHTMELFIQRYIFYVYGKKYDIPGDN